MIGLWIITAFAHDPFLFADLHVSLEGSIIIANHALKRIVKTVTDIVCARWNQAGTFDIVYDERFALGTDAFQDLCVEATIFLCAVSPILVLEWQVIIEEIIARYELASVPFCDISTLE